MMKTYNETRESEVYTHARTEPTPCQSRLSYRLGLASIHHCIQYTYIQVYPTTTSLNIHLYIGIQPYFSAETASPGDPFPIEHSNNQSA